jgi:hypothetical protein
MIRFDLRTSFYIGGPMFTIRLTLPALLYAEIGGFFSVADASAAAVLAEAEIIGEDDKTYALAVEGNIRRRGLTKGGVLVAMLALLREGSPRQRNALVQAGAVGWKGKAVLIAGEEHAVGDLIAWLVAKQFSLVSPYPSKLGETCKTVLRHAGPLQISAMAADRLGREPRLASRRSLRTGDKIFIQSDEAWVENAPETEIGLILHARHVPGAGAVLRRSGEQGDIGMRQYSASPGDMAMDIPCLSLQYDSFDEADDVLDRTLRIVLEQDFSRTQLTRWLHGLALLQAPGPALPPPAAGASIARPGSRPRLTIGMATFDDYDGVYFSVQAIRLFHPEILDDVEFIILDNHPDGNCAPALKQLAHEVPNCRYIAIADRVGPWVRDRVFQEAAGEIVLCMDCHVLLPAGSLKRMLDYFSLHPATRDLIQGPLLWDDLSTVSSHWAPRWDRGMYGVWDNDTAANDPDGAPFEIPMQGLGMFACRHDAWPGYNPAFQGFGGEEGYLHEKIRQGGGKIVCLPFLCWLHRFGRPAGVPYPLNWEDRFRNYLLGRRELNLSIDDVVSHMREYLGEKFSEDMLNALESEQDQRPARC